MLQIVQPVAQIDPKIVDHLDGDGLVKHLLKSLSIPASVIRSDEEVQAVRNEKEMQKAQAQQAEQQLVQSEVAKNTAPAIEAFNNMDVDEAV